MALLWNLNGWGVAALICAVAAFVLTYRVIDKMARKRRLAWGLLAGLASVPGASFALYYLAGGDPAPWYFEVRSWTGSELMVIPLGVTGALFAGLLPRVLLFAPLLGVVAFGVAPVIKPLLMPLPEARFSNSWSEDVCLQTTSSSCGPASSATLLRALGVEASERELARDAHTCATGTEAWYLARSLRGRGCEVEFMRVAEPAELEFFPSIIGVRLESGVGHFLPVLGKSEGRLIIADPLIGREELSFAEFEARYEFTGFVMRVSRD